MCFLSLKLFLSCPSLDDFQNGCDYPFISRVSCSSRSDCVFSLQLKGIFVAASKLRLLLSFFDTKVHCCSEIFSLCNEGGFHFSKFELRCSEHSLARLICLHPNWNFFFLAPFVHFHIFCNLNEKYIKLT